MTTINGEREAFQADAIAKVLACYEAGADRCQGYAPTGSGKTHIAAGVWDGLNISGIMVLVSPTRSVGQAEEKFRHLCKTPPRTLKVSGDKATGATRSLGQITRFLIKESGPRLIFSTDTSLPLVRRVLEETGLEADLLIVDESHRNATVRPAEIRAVWAEEAVQMLPARRRLYMTATPRTWEGDDEDLTVYSHHDEGQFGPIAFELTFDEAERRDIVLPIAIYGLTTDDLETAKAFAESPKTAQAWKGGPVEQREIAAHWVIYRAVTEGLQSPDGEKKRYHPRRIMISFNRVKEAEAFIARHDWIMREHGIPNAKAFGIFGRTHAPERDQIKVCVERLTYAGQPLDHAVIAQCGALNESFDLPDLDMTVIVTPKDSTLTVQQLIGRVTRLPVLSDKRWASVVTTDINPDETSVMFSVVRALVMQSETFRHELTKMEGDADAPPDSDPVPVSVMALTGKPLPEGFAESLRLELMPTRHPADWGDWGELIRRVREYVTEYGNADVPSLYVTPDGYKLGFRVGYARRRKSVMPASLVDALEALGFKWAVKNVLTSADVMEMRRRAADGESIASIARDMGFNEKTTGNAVTGRKWNHLPMPEGLVSKYKPTRRNTATLVISDDVMRVAEQQVTACNDGQVNMRLTSLANSGAGREIRLNANWTQAALAEYCRVDRTTVKVWERNHAYRGRAPEARRYLTWLLAAETTLAENNQPES